MDVPEHGVGDREQQPHHRAHPGRGRSAPQQPGQDPAEQPAPADRAARTVRLPQVPDRVARDGADEVQQEPAGPAEPPLEERADEKDEHEGTGGQRRTVRLYQDGGEQPPPLSGAQRVRVAPQRVEHRGT